MHNIYIYTHAYIFAVRAPKAEPAPRAAAAASKPALEGQSRSGKPVNVSALTKITKA